MSVAPSSIEENSRRASSVSRGRDHAGCGLAVAVAGGQQLRAQLTGEPVAPREQGQRGGADRFRIGSRFRPN